MKKGLLLIPSTYNGATLKNVLAVVFNKESREKNDIPEIGKVTFLENGLLKKIRIDSELLNPADAYDLLFEKLGLQAIEVRRVKVDDYTSQIPEIVLSAMKEVGAENIVIDLTNGLRDITGSLYSAAILCKISNLLYIEVKKYTGENGVESFYELDTVDEEINNKYTLKRFESIKEIEALASMNCMEFVMYSEEVDRIEKNNSSTEIKLLCNNLYTAIADYFRGEATYYDQSMRCIGVLNEGLVRRIADFMHGQYGDCIQKTEKKIKGPRERIEVYKKMYYSLSQKDIKADITAEEKALYKKMSTVFDELPALPNMIRSIQDLRNTAAHRTNLSNKEDAKIMIVLFLRILSGLNKINVLDDVYPDQNDTYQDEDV